MEFQERKAFDSGELSFISNQIENSRHFRKLLASWRPRLDGVAFLFHGKTKVLNLTTALVLNKSTFHLSDASKWIRSMDESCKMFKKEYLKAPSVLLMGLKSLIEISSYSTPTGCYIRKDLIGRINFIIHDNFVLDVLIADLPYKSFRLISDPSVIKVDNYQRILNDAVSILNITRNNILDHIRQLSLHGEMSDVNEMLQANDIQLKHYNLDDFKRVEDSNVKVLTETWYFLNEKIISLEDDDS